jgi:chorismate mutase
MEPPAVADELAMLTDELARRDEELIKLIVERGELARRLTAERVLVGAPRFDLRGEAAVARRFRKLGPAGGEIGILLCRLGRTSCDMKASVDLSR